MIELKQVTKEYGRATVLKNITLTLEEPGIYCLLGRNGAGKTTLCRFMVDARFRQGGWRKQPWSTSCGAENPRGKAGGDSFGAGRRARRGAASGLWVPPGGRKHTHGALYMPL